MKLIATVLILSAAAVAQSAPSNAARIARYQGVLPPHPSATATAPEQDVTLTIHLSADLATALEKDRLETMNPDGSAIAPTITDQILLKLQQTYFRQVMVRFPSPSLQAAQEAARTAQKAADDAATQAARAPKKP